ncbi:MAG: flagellar basal body rod protein FlgB [Lachnospiraceae bacterium]|jgi:flagellar basal-body rod protein FlgB|nr:flagellar basal body rod protein FlgB [Lachnospiraceae bacterium]
MITSGAFNYINILDKAADASWLRESAITNNLANVDTPGYKRQEVDFEGLLERELRKSKYITLDEKVKDLQGVHLNHLNATTYTDSANYSYRLDRNNVDIDTEEVELASEQIRYSALTDSIDQEFSRLKSVMG